MTDKLTRSMTKLNSLGVLLGTPFVRVIQVKGELLLASNLSYVIIRFHCSNTLVLSSGLL